MTTGLDRRTLLLSGLGFASLGRIRWIEQAFDPARDESPRRLALREAAARAKGRGMPLVVLVVPQGFDRHERGHVLGAYLELASESALADLALCEVTCAKISELHPFAPGMTIRFEGEPMALLVDWGRNEVRAAVRSSPRFPSLPEGGPRYGRTPDPWESRLTRWKEAIRGEIHSVIAPDRSELLRRTEEARTRLPETERDRLARLAASGGPWSATDVASCPAWALSAATTEAVRVDTLRELAQIARSRLLERSPSGSRWAKDGGCGDVFLEDPRDYQSGSGPCGTGYMPQPSYRFLWLYTKAELRSGR